MTCLTTEQLTALALEIASDSDAMTHVEQCETCRARLAEFGILTSQLSSAHAEISDKHAASRARLLATLASPERSSSKAQRWAGLAQLFAGSSPRRRMAIGGIGLTTAVGLLLLVVAWNSAGRLSAMERMAKKLQTVNSYSYQLFTRDTFFQEGETDPTTVVHTGTTYWLEPGSLSYEEKLVRTEGQPMTGEQAGGLLGHFKGVHFSHGPGIFINHATRHAEMSRTYFRVPAMKPHNIREGPIARLRMVRERAGDVLRELGTKAIEGKQARGYIMALNDAPPNSGFDALEVWVDQQTDLPLEFGFEVKTDDRTSVFRITNCQWNIELNPALFDTTPPASYDDITPPSDEAAINQIRAALKLYAQLSGGHYPRRSQVDADAVQAEMLKLAGFSGKPQPEWDADQRFRAIQDAKNGLDWIERILRHKYLAGYDGDSVRPGDGSKPLLWWAVDADDSYRVFYGDLRTEVIPKAQFDALGVKQP